MIGVVDGVTDFHFRVDTFALKPHLFATGFETRGRKPPLIVDGIRKARQRWRAFFLIDVAWRVVPVRAPRKAGRVEVVHAITSQANGSGSPLVGPGKGGQNKPQVKVAAPQRVASRGVASCTSNDSKFLASDASDQTLSRSISMKD